MAIDRNAPRVVLRGADGVTDALFYKTPLELAELKEQGMRHAGRRYQYVGCKDGEYAFVTTDESRGAMSEKRYKGTRFNGRARVMVEIDGDEVPLRHVVVHSPTGFEWGYAGSGPADLALSIMADVFNEAPDDKALYHGFTPCPDCEGEPEREVMGSTPEGGVVLERVETCTRCEGTGELAVRCMRYHQRFKFDFIATLDRDEPWVLEAKVIEEWLAAKGIELDGAAA